MAEITYSEYTIVLTYAYIDCALAVYRNSTKVYVPIAFPGALVHVVVVYSNSTKVPIAFLWRFAIGFLNWYVMPRFEFLRLLVQLQKDGDV